jgi:flagellar hook protein FlgE
LKFPAGQYTLPWATGSVNSFTGLNNGASDLIMNLDFKYSTQLNGSNSMNANNQDGYSLGTVNGFTVSSDGTVTVSATNGHFRDLGQLALANFNNPEGLRRLSNNVFFQTPNSGIPQIGEAMTGGRGGISSSFLEGSNVDLSEEFTRMIITQRAIQANSKVITTASEVLQEANNLVR